MIMWIRSSVQACVKVTPAHDFNDYAVGQRHGLEPINILTLMEIIKSSINPTKTDLFEDVAQLQMVY